MPPKLLEIGCISKPHGIRGEVCVVFYGESTDLLAGELWLQSDAQRPYPVKVARLRRQRGNFLLKFEGIDDRNAAELLRGLGVLVAADSLPDPPEDEIYLHELIGLDVCLRANGEPVGRLEHVEFIGGQELWVIRSADGREILFPAAPVFVDDINIEGRIIRISPPPGLLDLY
jgi:16S rRNA processing protein RimM